MIDERTRIDAQRLCTHVIARERKARTGRIGLWWTGDGIGTDALWLAGDGSLHRTADGEQLRLTTLAAVAAFAGVDLGEPLDVGRDTPDLGDPQTALALDPAALTDAVVGFYGRAFRLLGRLADGSPITLWPEHFDAAFVWKDRANVGASPGDGYWPTPYFYVGPWGDARPGGADRWNAPFGALVDACADDDAVVAFVEDRLTALAAT